MEPYADPLWGDLEALEQAIEGPPGPSPLWQDPDEFMDPLGKMLGQLEASIEAPAVPPAFEPEPFMPPEPEAGLDLSHGPTSSRPPVPDEHPQRYRGELQAAPAARPLFTHHEGLAAPSHRPRLGGSTGIKVQGSSSEARWCPKDQCDKDLDECRDQCPYWDEDAEECQYERTAEACETSGEEP